MVRVRVKSWVMNYAYESSHKDRNRRMCVECHRCLLYEHSYRNREHSALYSSIHLDVLCQINNADAK